LHYVVEHHPRESELLRLLVARGAEVNGPNPRPPLTAAQSEENIRTLIELGAKVDAHGPSAEDYSALQLAVMLHRREAAKTLLEAGANPNLNTYYPGFVPLPYREKPSRKYVAHEWMSPLHGAVADGDLNMVELLLKHHARTDMDSTHWGYPLDFAIFLEKWDISESLVAHGAKASLAHLQLDLAIRKHNLKQVQFCLRMGADPNRPDPSFQDQTPLHTAALADNLEAARMLLKAGAQCNRTNREGRRPVDLAISPTMRALLSPPGP
jgi:ankyrin repeat protein